MIEAMAAPMFQFAFVATLFKFRARGPSFSPLLQLPNRRATAQGDAVPSPSFIHFSDLFSVAIISLGECCAPPNPPRYAATPTGGSRRMAAPTPQCALVAT